MLVARIGATYGKTLYYDRKDPAVFASYLIRLTLDEIVLPKYYFYFSQSDYYWDQARNLATGAGQPQFNANAIKLINLPIPPIEDQKRIIEQFEKERALVAPAKEMVEVFTKKMHSRIHELWGE